MCYMPQSINQAKQLLIKDLLSNASETGTHTLHITKWELNQLGTVSQAADRLVRKLNYNYIHRNSILLWSATAEK